jgi:predicted alpha/beta hydrolase
MVQQKGNAYMKYYNVIFEFKIPVAIKDSGDDVDAYYAAHDKFHEYTLTEASVKINPIDQSKYDAEVAIESKLHGGQKSREAE